ISNSVYFYGTEPFEPPKEVQFWDFKLEKGSTATPWTPAPENITETNIINHTTPFVENNTIHTLRLYNRALTDEEIMQNYQQGAEGKNYVKSGLVLDLNANSIVKREHVPLGTFWSGDWSAPEDRAYAQTTG